jgi:hypothetical protein
VQSHAADLSAREAVVEAELERLRKTRVDLLNHELTISFQENTLSSKEELAAKEKCLAKKQLQELVAMRKKMEELHVEQADKA